ncbi:DUF2235 domain-containing protein [Phenylobacterium sp. LH3H17]|uniref:phospholipase effector Tle1 domain-containing protein n=1 Tax=Phenylobacterium sp. LH3H17 TaxID=2903901 RepID=UPI0020C9E57C|nr:DUF2235 domain-containing protein [Phenylobacterium sp. LH3H17]UTP39777.1 DUF2235 domain-containing protein [Phenylobacterium sp. LH3H17]
MATMANKRLVFCFDGTSNTLDRDYPTNVATTAAAVRNTSKTGPQIVYYDEGVGSTRKDALAGGAFGAGLYDKVIEAYKFLVFNHEPNDEIFIFGFSRGAYTARSFAGLIHHVGVVNSCFADKIKVATALYQSRGKDPADGLEVLNRFRAEFVTDCCASDEDRAWREGNLAAFDPAQTPVVRIRYVGVWDTVKTIGSGLFGDRDDDGAYDAAEFHDHRLHSSVESARHAVALDERRKKFDVTLWDNVDKLNRDKGFKIDDPARPYQQVWFPGDHGSVGGGGDVRGLSDEGLEWVLEGAKEADLELDTSTVSRIWGVKPDVLAPLENASNVGWTPAEIAMRLLPREDRKGPQGLHEVSRSAIIRSAAPGDLTPEKAPYRPKSLKSVAAGIGAIESFEPWEFQVRGSYGVPGEKVANIKAGTREFRRYVVAPGDQLAKIAKVLLGDPARRVEILALNRTTILDPDRLYVGQVINVPLA